MCSFMQWVSEIFDDLKMMFPTQLVMPWLRLLPYHLNKWFLVVCEEECQLPVSIQSWAIIERSNNYQQFST